MNPEGYEITVRDLRDRACRLRTALRAAGVTERAVWEIEHGLVRWDEPAPLDRD